MPETFTKIELQAAFWAGYRLNKSRYEGTTLYYNDFDGWLKGLQEDKVENIRKAYLDSSSANQKKTE